MSASQISGRVTVQPVRFGLLIAEWSMSGFHRAVELATSCWGGVTHPIVECNPEPPRAIRLADDLGVEVLVAVENIPVGRAVAEAPGFGWRTIMSRVHSTVNTADFRATLWVPR
jgi:hypothetical protein